MFVNKFVDGYMDKSEFSDFDCVCVGSAVWPRGFCYSMVIRIDGYHWSDD